VRKDTVANNKDVRSIKSGINTYFADVGCELRKVSWPTKDKVIRSTSVIIVIVMIFSLYISGLDYIFSRIFAIITRN